MPTFDLRSIKVAEYKKESEAITYEAPISVGDAMSCNLELRFAEGRLYAESTLAEFMKLATGGTISVGTKYIPHNAQILMYGAEESSREINAKPVKGLKFGAKNIAKYVGVAFYAPDMIDGVVKFTCVFVSRALFGPPSYVYQTKGESIVFQTPTTTGEFLADHTFSQTLIETAVVDTEGAALKWIDAVFKESRDTKAPTEVTE